MDTVRYAKLSEQTGKIGDEFYKCLAVWVRDPFNSDQQISCLKQAHEYEKALLDQIEYLRALSPSHRVESAVRTCGAHLAALRSQLDLLERKPDRGN